MSIDEKPRILYVDDEPEHLKLLCLQLQDEFEVTTASNGPEGMHAFSEKGPFAAVVSDMRMPKMNGAEFLSRIREQSPNTVLVLLTGDADLQSAMQAVNQAYVFRYLTKPCPREQLCQALRDAVEEHRRQAERDGLHSKLVIAQNQNNPVDSVDSEVYLGKVIAGRYRLDSVIGVGGTAVVFRCHDWVLQEDIALKLFKAEGDSDTQHRIKRELILARQLSHPNILRSYDIGIHDGCPFITMELLCGKDLRKQIETSNIDLDRGLDYLIQACRALDYAHQLSITHRDIKPENLFITDDGVLRVTDFGLAKKLNTKGVTRPDIFAGTIYYTSPEQIQDLKSVNHLTDIYALGAVSYELFTGRPPFLYDSFSSILAAHMTMLPEPPSTHNPALPEGIDDIILIALAKEPDQRFQSCEAMANALRAVQRKIG